MTVASRHRWSSAAAIGLTLLLFLSTARLEIPIQADISHQLVPDSLGRFHWGPLITLEPGHYRARAEMGSGTLPLGDPAEARGMVGFRPAGKPWGHEAWLLRGLEFNRSGERTLDFTFHIKEAGAYGWVWRAAPEKTEFELIDTRVDREVPLWSNSADGGEDGAGSLPLVLHALLAGALLVMAGTMGNRSARGQPESGAHYTWAGFGVYVLGGICLMTTGTAIGTDLSSSGWVFFPGMGSFSAAWPPWLAAAVALAAAWAIGVSVGRAKVLLWILPIAALGLWFGGLLAGPRSDFQIYYSAGLSLWGGVDPYAIRPERVLNPPPFVLATALFPLLPLTWSGFVWFGLKAAATVWCLFLARLALLPSSKASPARWYLRPEWVALWISGRYVFMDLQYGNTNVLVLLSLLLLAVFWRDGRKLGAGFASASGTAIKLTPMLSVVTAVLAGRIRWAVGAAVLSTAILLISAGVLEWRAEGAGMGFWRDVVTETGSMEMGRVDNQSLRGFTLRAVAGAPIILTSVPSIPNLGLDQTAAKIAEVILAACVLWLLFLLGRSAARGGEGEPGGWAGLWAGTALGILLLSPGSWSVHYALLYLPLVVLVDRGQRGQRPAAVISTLLAVIIVLPMFSRFANDWFTALSLLPILSLGALLVLVRGDPLTRSRQVVS